MSEDFSLDVKSLWNLETQNEKKNTSLTSNENFLLLKCLFIININIEL